MRRGPPRGKNFARNQAKRERRQMEQAKIHQREPQAVMAGHKRPPPATSPGEVQAKVPRRPEKSYAEAANGGETTQHQVVFHIAHKKVDSETKRFTPDEVDQVRGAFMRLVMEHLKSKPSVIPHIAGIYPRIGLAAIACADESTAKWVESQMLKLQTLLPEMPDLVLLKPGEELPPFKLKMFIPDRSGLTNWNETLQIVSALNPTVEWKKIALVRAIPVQEKNAMLLHLAAEEHELKALEAIGFRVFLGVEATNCVCLNPPKVVEQDATTQQPTVLMEEDRLSLPSSSTVKQADDEQTGRGRTDQEDSESADRAEETISRALEESKISSDQSSQKAC